MQMPLSEVKQAKDHKLIDQANLKRKRAGGGVPCTLLYIEIVTASYNSLNN